VDDRTDSSRGVDVGKGGCVRRQDKFSFARSAGGPEEAEATPLLKINPHVRWQLDGDFSVFDMVFIPPAFSSPPITITSYEP
jgi:hypothetical protein